MGAKAKTAVFLEVHYQCNQCNNTFVTNAWISKILSEIRAMLHQLAAMLHSRVVSESAPSYMP